MKHKDIVKRGILYLRRYYLSPRAWRWRLFLHNIAMPDDDRDPHDHPWGFWTLILRGGYHEHIFDARGRLIRWRVLRPGDIVYRSAEHTHQITQLLGPTWTLVLAGPATRVWGFTPPNRQWVPWYDYLRREDGSVPEQLMEDRVR